MKLINRIFASILFLTLLVPFTAFWQEETSANGACEGTYDVSILVMWEGKAKNKADAKEHWNIELHNRVVDFCGPRQCSDPHMRCTGDSVKVRGFKCKTTGKGWHCRGYIEKITCDCTEPPSIPVDK